MVAPGSANLYETCRLGSQRYSTTVTMNTSTIEIAYAAMCVSRAGSGAPAMRMMTEISTGSAIARISMIERDGQHHEREQNAMHERPTLRHAERAVERVSQAHEEIFARP